MSRTQRSIEELTESYCSQLKELKITSVVLSYSQRLLSTQQRMEKNYQKFFMRRELFQESRLIRVLLLFQEQTMNLPLLVLIRWLQWLLNIMDMDADLPNGELFSKLEMVYHQIRPSKRMHGDQPDMQQFAKRMDQSQQQNLKSQLMEIILLKFVKRYFLILYKGH